LVYRQPAGKMTSTVAGIARTVDLANGWARSMRVSIATLLSATGILGLALLSATHWAREAIPHPGAWLGFALGVLPNLAASFAMPLILASFLPSITAAPLSSDARRRFLFVLLFTTLGLCAWELIQTSSVRFRFDVNDLGATAIGAILAYASFSWFCQLGSTENSGSDHVAG
jgi:hypothetical protein